MGHRQPENDHALVRKIGNVLQTPHVLHGLDVKLTKGVPCIENQKDGVPVPPEEVACETCPLNMFKSHTMYEFGTFMDREPAHACQRGDSFQGGFGSVLFMLCPTPDGLPVHPKWRPSWAPNLKVRAPGRERLSTW